MKIVSFIVFAVVLASCGKAPQGNNQSGTVDSGVLVDYKVKAQSAVSGNCPGRGFHFQLWRDKNLNDTYEPKIDEGYSENWFCSRAQNQDEPSSTPTQSDHIKLSDTSGTVLTYQVAALTQAECATDGFRLQLWADRDKNDVYEEARDGHAFAFAYCDAKTSAKPQEEVSSSPGTSTKEGVTTEPAPVTAPVESPREAAVVEGKPGKDGKDGKDGQPGKDGKDGPASIVQTARFAHSPKCGGSGITVTAFTDVNGNGTFDAGIDSHHHELVVCDGRDGISKGIDVENVEHHASCKAKAAIIKTWTDVDGDGRYDAKVDKSYREDVVCHGKDFQSPFIATYASQKEVLRFDLNRFAQFSQASNGSRSGVYGEFHNYVTGAKNILVFEPKYFECREDGSTKLFEAAEFYQRVNAAVQKEIGEKSEKKTSAIAALATSEQELKKNQASTTSTKAGLTLTQRELSVNRARIADYSERLKGVTSLIRDKQAEGSFISRRIRLSNIDIVNLATLGHSLESKKSELETQIATDRARMETLASEVKKLGAQLAEHRSMQTEKTKNLDSVKQSALDESRTITQTEADIAKKGDLFGSKKRIVRKAKSALVGLIARKVVLTKELEVVASQIETVSQQSEQASETLKGIAQSVELAEKALSTTKGQLTAAETKKNELVSLVASLVRSHGALTIYVGNLEKSRVDLLARLADTRGQLDRGVAEESRLTTLLQSLAEKATHLAQQITEHNKSIQTLGARIAHLEPIPRQLVATRTLGFRFDGAGALHLTDREGKATQLDRKDADPIPKADIACEEYVSSLME